MPVTPSASPPPKPEPPRLRDARLPLVDDLQQQGFAAVGHHPEHRITSMYNVPRATADIKQAELNSRYFAISCYCLLVVAFGLRVFIFFVALFVGGLNLAELVILFVWVEPMVFAFVWTRWLGLLYLAFWIELVSFLAKGVYLALWIIWYYDYTDRAWWWIVTSSVGAYAVISFAAVFSIANITKAKLAFTVIFNDLVRIVKRRQQQPDLIL